MRKRRLMAAMLAGTMVFSSVAYADVQEQKHQPVLAQYQIATNTNADVKKEIPSGEETPGDPGQGTPEQGEVNQESVTIHLTTNNFKKTYGEKDPVLDQIPVFQYKIVSGSNVEKKGLTNIVYEREAGEKPGKYRITSISCDQYRKLKLDEESAYFTIEKKSIGSIYGGKMQIPDNGKEQTADVAALYYWKDEKKPTKIILKELSDEEKAKFEKLPTVDEAGMIHFTLKQLGNGATVTIPFTAEGEYYTYPEQVSLVVTVQKVNLKTVDTHSPDEIRAFLKDHPFSISYRDAWTVTPNAKNNEAGVLTNETIQNALNTLNFIRYIAGLDADVSNDAEYAKKAQAGTTLLTEVGKLSHTPKKPASVSQEFYDLGYSGTSASNLGLGYTNLSQAVIDGWMDDGDSSNIDRVGHRRWCINPTMSATGFGHSGSYTAMYSFDEGNTDASDISYVMWPAQNMPVEYFYGPWSVSINSSILKVTDKQALKITMTKQDGSSVVLDSSCTNKSGKYFNYNGGGYGIGPAIIFKPAIKYSASDVVTVKIEGIQDKYGNDVPLEYTVTFFNMNKSSSGGSSGGSGGSHSSGGSSGGSGGSHSSGGSSGGGGGSSSRKVTTTNTIGGPSTGSLPSYVVRGNWKQTGDKWGFKDNTGKDYKNQWAAVVTPYASTAAGQSAFDWFRFDEAGQMMTGWVTDPDGNIYYCNPISDNTRGKMMTGWVWIPDANGVKRCYYFNPVSDGYRGKLLKNTVIEGSSVNADGAWIVNGVVQTK